MVTVDQLHFAVTRITTHYYSDDRTINPEIANVGTGFFYKNMVSNILFLITNRHVIRDEKKDHIPNVVRIRLHTDPSDMTKNTDYDIHLYNLIKPIWRNPKTDADIVAIPLDEMELNQKGLYAVSFAWNNLLPSQIQLHVNDDVFVLGYPLDLYDDLHNLPTAIGGTLASPYPIPWRGNPYFLVNASLDKGTSGSPVITKFKPSWRLRDGSTLDTGFAIFLLGINSARFPARVENQPTQLNATYFGNIIEDMTK